MRKLQLIQLYSYVEALYDDLLRYYCEHRSINQSTPDFTDIELITTYLYMTAWEKRCEVKSVYECTRDPYLDWFPDLPSYQAYNRRLNELNQLFPLLIRSLAGSWRLRCPQNLSDWFAGDSMPIITCGGKREAKVARELCDKAFNSTKSMWYHGIKLHSINRLCRGELPRPDALLLSAASQHDLNANRELLQTYADKNVFLDKAFTDADLEAYFEKKGGALMLPVKYHRGHTKAHKQRHEAADNLYSTAVSKVRQPIESFFNWLIERTGIQRASKVRSTKGLLVHTFGKFAAAMAWNVFGGA